MFFKNILFHNITAGKAALTQQLCAEILPKNKNIVFQNWNPSDEADGSFSLIICDQPQDEFYESVYFSGNPFCISWKDFILDPVRYLLTVRKPALRTVVLGFLPGYFEKISCAIFSLYGFSVKIVRTEEEMQAALLENPDYVLADIDMKNLNQNRKTPLLKEIRHAAKDRSVAVNVVKDFNHGSLYEDLCSPVKDFCDILLSHEEYIVFILRFLYRNETDKYLLDEKERTEKRLEKSNRGNIPEKPLRNIFNGLRNPKKTYYKIMQDEEDENFLHLEEALTAELHHKLTSWMIPFITVREEDLERSAFTFAVPNDAPGRLNFS